MRRPTTSSQWFLPRTQCPTAAPTTYTQPRNLPSSIPAAVFISTPETKPPQLGFGFLLKIRHTCLHERTQCSTTAVTLYPPPHHHLSLIPNTVFISAPETEPLQLNFHFFGPSIGVRARTTRDKRKQAREGSAGGMDGYRGGSNKIGDDHRWVGTCTTSRSGYKHEGGVRGEWQWGSNSNGNSGSVSISGYSSSTCSSSRAAGAGVLNSSLPPLSFSFLLLFNTERVYSNYWDDVL
jgi:hypothetical protein